MVDDDKPFPCTSPGCAMKFANEDHLSIHKKRHMALSIESNNELKSPVFIADETPTPTRFIRNCEEVGLFQDLQNVNPFDEQFRRAAEAAILASAPNRPTIDDALHTPHVFPVSSETDLPQLPELPPPKSVNVRKSFLMPTLSASDCLISTSPLPTPTPSIIITGPSDSTSVDDNVVNENANSIASPKNIQVSVANTSPTSHMNETQKKRGRKPGTKSSPSNIKPRPVVPNAVPLSPSSSDPLQLLLRLPDGRLVQIPAIPVDTESNLADTSPLTTKSCLPTIPVNIENSSKSPMSETKMKLKQVLAKSVRPNGNTVERSLTISSEITSPQMSNNMCENNVITSTNRGGSTDSSSPTSRKRNHSTSDPDDDKLEKRRKFLERNRAAAHRSRQKRKRWVNSLESKNAALSNTNKLLQNEIATLRSEIAQLKVQLLAHKDCSVTLAMKNQSADAVAEPSSISPTNPVSFAVPPAGVSMAATQSSRQIIILNTTTPAIGLPVINRPISPTVLLNSQPPIVVFPGTISENKSSSNVAINNTNLTSTMINSGQKTSVIISSRSTDK